MTNTKNSDVFQEAAAAYEVFIQTCDRARLRPSEIRGWAEAIGNVPAGESFTVTISANNPAVYSKTVSVDYGG